MKKRLIVSTLTLLATLALEHSMWGQDFSAAARKADFSSFVQNFTDSYAYRDRTEKPWLTWEARYGGAIDRAETKAAFDTVLAAALSELHDFHAEVRSGVPDRWLPVPTFADIWAEFKGSQAVVTAVRGGSDAARADVEVGDRVTAVSSVSLEQAIADRLTPAVDQADPGARQWALLSILTGRSEEARTFNLVKPSGATYTVKLPVERRFDRPSGDLTATTLAGNIGLIRFNNSLGEQKTVAAFDQALSAMRATKGLVLDLRDVPSGGDSSIALGIMGRFVTKLLPYQRHRIPHYGQTDVERNWIELVAPRGPFTYTAPVVVLVNHWTGSMGEGMAIGFDAMQRAIVVGTPMAHLAGAVSDDRLPKTGVDVAYATEQIFAIDGTPRQDWLPPVLVTIPVGRSAGDPILTRALAELSASKPLPKRRMKKGAGSPAARAPVLAINKLYLKPVSVHRKLNSSA